MRLLIRRDKVSDVIKAAKAIRMEITTKRAAPVSPFGACVRLYKAKGKVCVSPGMFDTKVIVAPNSPRLRAKAKIVPVKIPGRMSGRVTVMKTHLGDAPKVRAACSNPIFTSSKDNRMERTINGSAIIPAATAAPFQLNAKEISKVSQSQLPINPCLPSNTSNKYPTTTGGNTSGR